MHCPHCRFEVAADFQFCPKCGNKLSRDCPQCGYVCPLEFRYCPKCGTEIAKATTVVPESAVDTGRSAAQVDLPPPARPIPEVAEAERSPVTVLFADVVGFTSLAEQLDPEELRSLMMGCFQTLAEEIRRYDGFIEKFIGDAILAVFGAPVAHEDDPSGQSGPHWACRPGCSSCGLVRAVQPPEHLLCGSASTLAWWWPGPWVTGKTTG